MALAPARSLESQSRLHFSVGSLLLLTGVLAVVIARWPIREHNWQPHAAFAAVTAALFATVLLTPAAWRIAQHRRHKQAASGEQSLVTDEMTALGFGIASVLTYGPLWLFSLIAPFESTNPLIHGAMVVDVVFAAALCPLIVLGIGISLLTFWGALKNPPLLAIRVFGLLGNFAVGWGVISAIAGID